MVRIARFALREFRLPLAAPLVTAHGAIDHREGVIAVLESAQGRSGLGEAAPLPGFAVEPLAAAREALVRGARALTRRTFASLDAALDAVLIETEKAPCARAALDTALHDLAARERGVGVAEWLARAEGRAPRSRVAIAALVGARDPRAAALAAHQAVADGYRAVKLKIGAGDDDEARVAAVRAVCPPAVALRLDANAAWSEAEALDWLARLAAFAPAWIEQPVASLEALARLRARSPVPIAVDEGLADEACAERVAAARAADGWIVKPAVVGGLRAARRIAARAHRAGARAVVSGFLDTAVGASAALALAAALPDALPAGLGPALARDLAERAPVEDGARPVPPGPGLGIAA